MAVKHPYGINDTILESQLDMFGKYAHHKKNEIYM